MFINIQYFRDLYDAITSAISGEYKGIFESRAKATPSAEANKLSPDEIIKVFGDVAEDPNNEALTDLPTDPLRKMRPLPPRPCEVIYDNIPPEKSLLIPPIHNINKSDDPPNPPIKNLNSNVGKSVKTNSVSPKAQPDNPSAFDDLVDKATRIMDSQGTVLLSPDFWSWPTREEQKKDKRIDPNMVGKEPAPFLIPLDEKPSSVPSSPLSSIPEKGFVPKSSIQEEHLLKYSALRNNTKKLTLGIKKLSSVIDTLRVIP